MNLISGIDVTAGALNAQKTRLDIVAQNIANAQTTRTATGGAYQRQIVSFESELVRRTMNGASLQSVRVASIAPDRTPGQQVYNPQHPDATADGLVTMPNVNLSHEMVDLITASRAYEADVTAMQAAKSMFSKTLDLLR